MKRNIPNQNPKLKMLFMATACSVFFVLAGDARAAIFVDNAAAGCSNGSTSYNPSTRSCSGGSDKVYVGIQEANDGILSGTDGSPTVVNLRQGTYIVPSQWHFTINKNWTTWRRYPGDSKPVIDGNNSAPDKYRGLISVVGTESSRITGVTFDGLVIKNALDTTNYSEFLDQYNGREGIWLENTSRITVQNCEFSNLGASAMYFYKYSDNSLIQDNSIYDACIVGQTGWYYPGAISITGSNDWDSSIVRKWGENHTIRRNTIQRVHGEAILVGNGMENVIIEYNSMSEGHIWNVHISNANNVTIRHNLSYNCEPEGWNGKGIILDAENVYWDGAQGWNSGFYIYGNMTYGGAYGFGIVANGEQPNSPISDVYVYNNTFIEASMGHGYEVALLKLDPGQLGRNINIKNNIFFQSDDSPIANVPPGVNFGNNLWSKAPDIDARSSTDPTNSLGYPTLNITEYLQKTDWSSVTPGTLTGQEFALRSTAVHAIGKGTSLGYPYNQLLNLSASNFKTNTFNLIDQNANGAWEIGAGVYSTGPIGPVCGNLNCETGETYASCPADCVNGTIIPRTSWTCTADSEESVGLDGSCENAFDSNISTAWHTSWTGTSPLQPHNIDINLGGAYQISGLRYIPRQVDGTSGIVMQYEIYSSTDAVNWTKIASGNWTYSAKEAKDISFTPTNARYVRFKSLDDNTSHWTSAAEIVLLGGTISGDSTAPSVPGGLSVR